ncbi:MAG: S41 family peptidase [Vicinamibacterales bacterium]
MRCRWVLALLVVAVLTPPAPARAQSSCSALGQATFVRDTLDEVYLWYRDLPDLDPADYDSPDAYLAAARVRPRDATFSYIQSRAASDALFSESQFVGLGLSTAVVDGELRVLQVFDGGPAAEAGLDRGSRLTAIAGRAVADLLAAGTVDDAFGPAEADYLVTLGFETRNGTAMEVALRKRTVTIPTVSLTRVFDVGGRRVGYVFFRNFVRPSAVALDEAFAALRQAGVRELVLDLRYNGGGLVDVAVHLAGLIAGPAAVDQVFAQSHHNDRNRRLDATLRFGAPSGALGLDRVVVIATKASASASELLINGLRPFVPVVIVGDRTYGKPVGQYLFPFCDRVLAPVAFSMTNADGQGGYFDGLPADCPAADDIEHELGDPGEASLATALGYIAAGSCRVPSGTRARRADLPGARPQDAWQVLVNAR